MKLNIMMLLCALLLAISAGAQITPPGQIVKEVKTEIKQISVEELKAKMDSSEAFFLVDVRTEEEFLCGHLQNAIWISRGFLEFDIQKKTKDPEAVIVLYCRSGGRSALAAKSLNGIGYRNVFNLDTGFKGWIQAGYAVFNRHGEIKVINFEKKEN